MLASYFARNYAMYALTGHYRGANLVVPNFFVPVTNEELSLQSLTASNMCSVTPTKTEALLLTSSDGFSGGENEETKQSSGHDGNSYSKPEIKFSIDRILSIPSHKAETVKDSHDNIDTGNDDAEVKVNDGKEFDISEDAVKYSWLQCTRYKPPKLQRLRKKEGGKKRKLGRNPRVPFTQYQVATLEQKFCQTHYLSSIDVAELSSALNLTETRVKIWFQNRRARERRDRDTEMRTCPGLGHGRGQTMMYHAPTSTPGGSWGLNIPTPQTSLSRLQKAIPRGGSAFTPVSYSSSRSST